MTRIDVNVLMIGRSGTGKSSLLNYLYGQEVEKIGAGKPVTKKGIFEHTIDLNNSCRLHIFDTWGLEPNKTGEWQELVHEEIRKHDVDSIKDWFHFILYCISAQSARIEDFEEAFIKSLHDTENHVIVVLTHCDNANEKNLDKMITYLNKIGIKKDDIIMVCSVETTLVGGRKTHRFGKESLLDKIQKSFWYTICDKVPKIIRNKAVELIDEETKDLKNYVDKSINIFNIHSDRNYDKLNNYCNERYSQCMTMITRLSEEKMNESIDYYLAVCNTLFLCAFGEGNKYKSKAFAKINYSMDFTEKLAENIASAIVSLIPLVNLLVPKLLVEMKQDEYKEQLDNTRSNLIKQCDGMCDNLSDYLRNLNM